MLDHLLDPRIELGTRQWLASKIIVDALGSAANGALDGAEAEELTDKYEKVMRLTRDEVPL